MRFRLRTLMIVFAATPALLAFVTMWFIERADSSQQSKDRETRRMLHVVRDKVDLWLRASSDLNPSKHVILAALTKQVAAHCNIGPTAPHPPVDAWGREIVLGFSGWHDCNLFARSRGANGFDEEGQGDDIQVTLMFPRYGINFDLTQSKTEP